MIVAAPGATNVPPAGRLVLSGKKVPGGRLEFSLGTSKVVVVVVEPSEAFGLVTVVTVVLTVVGVGGVVGPVGTSTNRWLEMPLDVATCTSRTQRCLHWHSGAFGWFAVLTACAATWAVAATSWAVALLIFAPAAAALSTACAAFVATSFFAEAIAFAAEVAASATA